MKTTNRSFRAARQLKLHQRAVDCLDMIVTCDKRIGDAKYDLNLWDKAGSFSPIRLAYNRNELEANVLKYELIKLRLTEWYCDIMARINDVALEHLESKPVSTLTEDNY